MTERKQITKAIIAVMQEVKGIEKDMTVGNGQYSYQGVSDKIVKQVIGNAMEKNGLAILPIGIESKVKVDRWEEEYKGQIKQKQSVFTEVNTQYLLLHESGESMEIAGYGHGVDSQDKSAGKATTYALKYALLYTFMVPTGKIDDPDVTHSNDIETPKASSPQNLVIKKEPNSKEWQNAVDKFKTGSIELKQIENYYILNADQKKELEQLTK